MAYNETPTKGRTLFKSYLTVTSFLLYFLYAQSEGSPQMFYLMSKASELNMKAMLSGQPPLTEAEMDIAMTKAIEEDFPDND